MQRSAAGTGREKMDFDEKKCKDTLAIKTSMVKPFAVLFAIIVLAVLSSTIFLNLEWKVHKQQNSARNIFFGRPVTCLFHENI